MIHRNIISLIIILSLLIPVPLSVSAWEQSDREFTPASGEAWLTGWTFRKSHNITGEAGAGADYQVMIIVEYGSGTDSSNTVYLNSRSQTDFGDIRVTGKDGITELDYWIETKVDGESAIFWVQVQDTLSSDATIYIYFGRSSTITTTSDGDVTFSLFSDFSRFMDTDTWTRYANDDSYVKAADVSLLATIDTIGKCEGIAYDGEYFYLGTYSAAESESWLYQIDDVDFEIIESIEITKGTRTHVGGISLYDGYLYVALSEPLAIQTYPSEIQRYHAETLTFSSTVIDSSDYLNDHWGGVVIIGSLDRMYVANWGCDELYVFQIDGTYVTKIETPPDLNIQDMVYIEKDNLIYGSKQLGDSNIISVWRPDGIGNSLSKVGEVLTEDGRTHNGFTWYNDYFYSCVVEPDDLGDNYLRKLYGANINMTIDDYSIYTDATMGTNVMLETRLKMGGNRKFNLGWCETLPDDDDLSEFHNYEGDINYYFGAGDYDTGFDLAVDTWTTLSLGWQTGKANAYKNRGSEYTLTAGGILGTASYTKMQLWGSADAPIYCSWIFVRNWQRDEPTHSEWGSIEVYSIVDEGFLWGIDLAVIFLGLFMIPASVLFLVRGGKKELNSDKVFYAILAFVIGWALFLGGIMP